MVAMLRLLREGPAPTGGASSLTLVHGGETILVALRRSQNARRFTLRVRFAARDAVLTMPQRASLRDAHHLIDHHPERRGVTWIESRESADVPFALCVAGQAEYVHRRVQDHFKREARRDLEEAVARHTAALALPPRGVGLRDPISRWGSCSASGSLNFSWRLIMAPPFVLDYLAAHEVAHLVHLDHSPRFWKLTRRLCADTDRAEAWLSAHGAHLHKYGAKAR